jgi:hypothetical protein
MYFGRGRKWTRYPSEALAFVDEIRARDYAVYNRLGSVSIAVLPDGHGHEAAPSPTPAQAGSAHETKTRCKTMKSTRSNPPQFTTRRLAAKRAATTATSAAQDGPRASGCQPRIKTATAQPRRTPEPQPASPPSDPAGETITIEAKVDVGFGNALFIRGEGAGLRWDTGMPLVCVDGTTWVWSAPERAEPVRFKLLLNDAVWCHGEDLTAEPGRRIEVVPTFH